MLLAACLAAIAIFVAAPAWAQQYVPGRMLVRWKPGLKAAAGRAADRRTAMEALLDKGATRVSGA